jgi:prolyl oligopeptidase
MVQRPELFCGVICLGPLLDMLRYHLFDDAIAFADEYGTADDVDDFRCLYSYSPYHRLNKGVEYPAVLFVSGDSDTRCNPLHVRKMVAALQALKQSKPVLMQYASNWGHCAVQPLNSQIEALADRLVFLCDQLGLKDCKSEFPG